MLSSVLIALRDFTPDDAKAFYILEGLASIEKIGVISALLPEEDILRLRDVIRRLEISGLSGVSDRISTLKLAFGLKE